MVISFRTARCEWSHKHTTVPNADSADAAKVWRRMRPEKLSQKSLRLVSLPRKDTGDDSKSLGQKKAAQKKPTDSGGPPQLDD